ncbi:MAG: FAD-dependent oxidoreductase [Kiritimatiellaeota bacterium]|nr:FAD-dependent oxidoreductase [Kiritimatiellota bacterium]
MDFEKKFDVIVAGAGVAGVAAALEAARSGARTVLIEKTVFPGGLATSGMVNVYLPLCDGRGRQVTFGVAEELLHAAIRYGPGGVSPDWRRGNGNARYRTAFSPAAFVLTLDELLLEAGVGVWLDTLVCAPVMDGARVTGLEVENKSGRGRLGAACIVDATGDADVAYRAGAACIEQDNWLSLWALEASLDAARKAVAESTGSPLLRRVTLGGWNNGHNHPGDRRKRSGTNGRDVSAFVLESRELLRKHYLAEFARGEEHNRHNVFPLSLPSMAQFRTTRRIVGRNGMAEGQEALRRDDSVGLVADWRTAGHVWEVPYGALAPAGVDGLLAAGRCIDAAEDVWEVMRVIPAAALTGQVAGLAAALSVRDGVTPGNLDVRRLQQELTVRGIPLHRDEVGMPDMGAPGPGGAGPCR